MKRSPDRPSNASAVFSTSDRICPLTISGSSAVSERFLQAVNLHKTP